jgi:O-antigen/teichoic acid export membrane protein
MLRWLFIKQDIVSCLDSAERMHQLSQIVLRNSLFSAGAQIAIKILSFGFSVLVIRRLGPAEFGQYGAILAIGAVFMVFSDLGLSPYTVREVARLRAQPDADAQISELYGNVLVLRVILTFFTALLQIGAAWLAGEPLLIISAVALNSFGLLLYSIQGATDAVLQGYERLDITARTKVMQQLLFVALGTLTLFLHVGFFGLIGASLCGIALLTIACWRGLASLGVRPGKIDPRRWLGLLRVCFPFGVIGLTLGLSYKFDSVLLYHYHGDIANGLYTAAYNLVFSTAMLSNIINTSLYPSLSRQAQSDPGSLSLIYDRILRYLLVTGLPIAVGGSILAEQLILLIGGESYRGAIDVFRILILVSPLMFVSEYLGYIVLIQGNEKLAARSVLISTSVNVLANIVFIPQYGMMAAAWITVVTEIVLVIQYGLMLRKSVHFERTRTILQPLMAVGIMGLAVLFSHQYIPLVASVLLGAVVYIPTLLLLNVIGRDELAFVRNLRSPSSAGISQ